MPAPAHVPSLPAPAPAAPQVAGAAEHRPVPAPFPAATTRPAAQLQVARRQDDGDAIAPLQARLHQAMANGDLEQARQAVDGLASQLPDDSLTLLRAQAWLAHADNDIPAALQAYRQIVARVPDDAHAGANLALLLAASGQTEQAHAALARLSLQHADNPLLRRARAALETAAP